jgi:hypothetical protein
VDNSGTGVTSNPLMRNEYRVENQRSDVVYVSATGTLHAIAQARETPESTYMVEIERLVKVDGHKVCRWTRVYW